MENRGWSVDLGGGKRLELPPMPQMPRIPRIPRGGALLILGVAAALFLIVTGYYQVEPDEVAVVQRFGKFVRTTEPGPHIKVPFGVEQITKVPVKRQLKMEFGFRTARAAAQTTYAAPSKETIAESQMLTGDLNVAVVEWIVQYLSLIHISEPTRQAEISYAVF